MARSLPGSSCTNKYYYLGAACPVLHTKLQILGGLGGPRHALTLDLEFVVSGWDGIVCYLVFECGDECH